MLKFVIKSGAKYEPAIAPAFPAVVTIAKLVLLVFSSQFNRYLKTTETGLNCPISTPNENIPRAMTNPCAKIYPVRMYSLLPPPLVVPAIALPSESR